VAKLRREGERTGDYSDVAIEIILDVTRRSLWSKAYDLRAQDNNRRRCDFGVDPFPIDRETIAPKNFGVLQLAHTASD
jgi:hypothetical protein